MLDGMSYAWEDYVTKGTLYATVLLVWLTFKRHR